MANNDTYYRELLIGYINNSSTPAQVQELYGFINRDPEAYEALMDDPEVLFRIRQQLDSNPPQIVAGADQRFRERIQQAVDMANATIEVQPIQPKPVYRKMWFRYAAAAAVVFLITLAGINYFNQPAKQTGPDTTATKTTNDAKPGHDGATLTLADGSQVQLDSLGNGIVTTQGKTTVLIKDGKLVYNASANQGDVLYNTMTTANGRQYQLVLPDGSHVWLNAASSITYPTAFAANERKVTVTGEAYFEVAKDPSRPFKVSFQISPLGGDKEGARTGMVEVLGTHFNINSYGDEGNIKTTLLEGSVRVTNNNNAVTIKPGEQAVVNAAQTSIAKADINAVMAWKNGKFDFNRTPLPVVMRQLSRWYDIEVEYQGKTPEVVFAGRMGRDLNLSQVLLVLSKMEVNFKIEGKKLIVMP